MTTTAPPMPPPAHTAPLPPARLGVNDVRILDGVPYAALPGIRPLELDLYLPADRSTVVPVVVFLHRGAGGSAAGVRPDPLTPASPRARSNDSPRTGLRWPASTTG